MVEAGPPEAHEVRIWAESIYPEGITQAGHTSVWGSYYCAASQQWGYACCKGLEKDKICKFASPEDVAEWAKIQKRRAIREERARKERKEKEKEREQERLKNNGDNNNNKDEEDAEPSVPRKLEAHAEWRNDNNYQQDEQFIEHSLRHILYRWKMRQVKGFERRDPANVVQNEKLFKESKNNVSKFCPHLKTIEKDNIKYLKELVNGLKNNDYATANQKYMSIAIGHAAWQAGSQAQSGIFSGKEAGAFRPAKDHDAAGDSKVVLMDDEGGKKFMFTVKRLINVLEQLNQE